MTKPRFIALVLWLLAIADGVRQGLILPSQSPANEAFSSFGVVMLLLPIIFFTVAPLWMKGHPFDLAVARVWVNGKYGESTYESYTQAIKPLALFAAVAATIGFVALVASVQHNAAPGAYATAGFFISSAAGFLSCRYILRRRGNTIE